MQFSGIAFPQLCVYNVGTFKDNVCWKNILSGKEGKEAENAQPELENCIRSHSEIRLEPDKLLYVEAKFDLNRGK